MKNVIIVIIGICVCGLGFSQSANTDKGSLLLSINGGFRGNFSSHSTPQLSFNGLIANFGENDRLVFSPAWNFQGSIGYQLPKIPLSFYLQSGIQWNQNVHYASQYWFMNDYPSKKIGFRTINMGVSARYQIFHKQRHSLSISLGVNALYIPFSYPDFKETKNPSHGELISKKNADTISYITVINSISTKHALSWQMEVGFDYTFAISKHFDLNFILTYQLGLTNLLNTSAVFFNSSDPNYTGNSSFSVNKGDGLCLNLGVGYKIPFHKKE